MKFPRTPEKLDKRKKLTLADINKMKLLFAKGYSKRHIGRCFFVSSSLVCYHLNGDEYKEKWLQKCLVRIREKQKQKDFREKHNEIDLISKKRKRKVVPLYNEYLVENCKKWRNLTEKNREKWREYSRKGRLKLKNKI